MTDVPESAAAVAEWYSDEALAKQALADELTARGERVPMDVMLGILAPRVEPTEAELCANCGCDARGEVGGEAHGGKRWCGICIGRGRHIQYVADLSAVVAAVREWCDAQKPCAIGKGCVRCAVRAEVVREVRSLLPSVEAAGGGGHGRHTSDVPR